MNRIWSFICLLCGGSTLFAQPLTWEACQRQAHDRYPLIRQYKLIEQTTQLSVANLQKGYYPQLSVSAQASYVSDVPAFPDAMKKMFSSVVSLDGIPKDQYKVAVDVNQVVWDGGEIRARRQLSQTEVEVAARETDVNLYALRARINELFFGLLLLDEQVKQQCAQDGLLGAHIARMEAYVRDSVGLPSDLDAILAQRLQLRQQLTSLLSARRTYSRVLSLFVAEKPTKVATMSIGYADGLPRLLSNQGFEVLVHGQRCKLIGNLCMDQCMIDVTDVDDVKEGDVVCIVGHQGNEVVTVDQISRTAKTINNETLTSISSRVPRLKVRS